MAGARASGWGVVAAIALAACGGGGTGDGGAFEDAGATQDDGGATRDGGGATSDGGGVLLPGDELAPFEGGPSFAGRFPHGPSGDPSFFPITVWLQSPRNADRYRAIGVNTFIGLWEGPTDDQLSTLAAASMPAMCDQNDVGLAHVDEPTIVGWTQDDEPDNAQPDGSGGYGPCIAPSEIVSRYDAMRAADPTRPVFLNLGQAVANTSWVGRGSECSGPGRGDADYPTYAMGGDIVSFDFYPVNSHASIGLVAFGVDRLREWTGHTRPVWNWIETTRISPDGDAPTPDQVRAEVWMSLIHGSLGIGYFAHVIDPFDETGLLDDETMSAAVADIDAQIAELAPVLNTPSIANGATVESSDATTSIDLAVKRAPGATYLFAIAMGDAPTTATFTLRALGDATADVLGESRTVDVHGGTLVDDFDGWEVHLYRIAP